MTNQVGFSTNALSKPRVSLAVNRAHWYTDVPKKKNETRIVLFKFKVKMCLMKDLVYITIISAINYDQNAENTDADFADFINIRE